MNALEIIQNSQISQMNIADDDKSTNGEKFFADAKQDIAKAIDTIGKALPKMKNAGTDMEKASDEVDSLLRNLIRKAWGDNEISFYTTRDGNKAIVSVTARNIDDISAQIQKLVANY